VERPRIAVWMIWGAYLLLAVLAAAFFLLLESKALDIGGVTFALILMGLGSLFVAAALLAGSAIGTFALVTSYSDRSTSVVLTVIAGWIGSVLLGWLAWSFWTE
jgi:hypothetical protein